MTSLIPATLLSPGCFNTQPLEHNYPLILSNYTTISNYFVHKQTEKLENKQNKKMFIGRNSFILEQFTDDDDDDSWFNIESQHEIRLNFIHLELIIIEEQ